MADHQLRKLRVSFRKKATYAFLVTATFFVVVEGLLALCNIEVVLSRRDPFVGFESSIPLFVEQIRDDGAFLRTAENKLRYFNPQRFAKDKPDNVIRIFCLGGSTTYGRPYDDTTSFAGWLRELLPLAAADQQWEVINAGGISYASYRVAATMEELCEYSPDVFIVYTGHNEFLEERTYREFHSMPPGMRRLTTLLHQTRTFSLAHRLIHHENPQSGSRYLLPREVDTILDHDSGPNAYHRDDELREDILEHFEFNLARMIETARSVNAKVVFVTPAANLKDFSPFKSQPDSDLDDTGRQQCSELLAQAIALEKQGELSAALDVLEQATEIDDRRADLHFLAGRLKFALGQFTEARTAFLRATDEDVCPLRAVPKMQRIIERVAIANRVPLVDFDSILRDDCLYHYGHDSPGREYFLDHVHPTIAAHRLLAIALVEALIQKGITAPGQLWRADAVALASQRIESRVDDELRARALTNLAQVLCWAGKQEEAGPIAVEAVRLRAEQGLAEDAESMFYAAVHLAMTGSNERATELLERVTEHEPNNAEARWRLATLLYDQARFDEARHHFAKVIQQNPADADSHHMLGVISLRSHQYEAALASLQRADELTPNDAGICVNIAFSFQQLGRDEEAIDWYQKVTQLDVGATKAHRQLGRLLLKRGRFAEAIDQFEKVLQFDSNAPGILDELQRAREQLHHADSTSL